MPEILTNNEVAPPPPDAMAGRLTSWVEGLSRKRHARWILFLVAFIEASVFPVPPDPLLITLSLGSPRKSFWFAFICAAGSVMGSLAGYAIGSLFFTPLGRPLLAALGVDEAFMGVLLQYREHAILTLVLAGFTPVPFAVFTIAAGFNGTLSLGTLLFGSLLGRTIRFGIVGGLLMLFGEPVKRFLVSHRVALAVALAAVVVMMYLSFRWLL